MFWTVRPRLVAVVLADPADLVAVDAVLLGVHVGEVGLEPLGDLAERHGDAGLRMARADDDLAVAHALGGVRAAAWVDQPLAATSGGRRLASVAPGRRRAAAAGRRAGAGVVSTAATRRCHHQQGEQDRRQLSLRRRFRVMCMGCCLLQRGSVVGGVEGAVSVCVSSTGRGFGLGLGLLLHGSRGDDLLGQLLGRGECRVGDDGWSVAAPAAERTEHEPPQAVVQADDAAGHEEHEEDQQGRRRRCWSTLRRCRGSR